MRRPAGRRPSRIAASAAAKVNLAWSVGEARPDGYHDVEGLVQTISLHDTLVVDLHDDPGEVRGGVVADVEGVPVGLEVSGDAHETGADDLILRAARALARTTAAQPTSITLTKVIPVAAGLGGGSADAAAALMVLGLAWGAKATAGELIELGAAVGSDVPAILHGGLVHVSGRGERVRGLGCASGLRLVLGVADTALATADVYRRLDELRAAGAWERPTGWCANDLEPAAAALDPGLPDRLEAMREAGAPVVFLAGSGPTVVGVVPDPGDAEAVARRATPAFARTHVATPSPWGVRLALGRSA